MIWYQKAFLKTAYEIEKNLSYLILNMLALFTTKQIFDLTFYNPNWKNRSVVLSNFSPMSSDRLRIPVVSKIICQVFNMLRGDR